MLCWLALVVVAFVLAVVLSGCATVNDNLELGWQAEHVVDVLQTEHGAASDACYYEGDPATRAVIGMKPSRAAVAGWGVGFGALHYGVTRVLERWGMPWMATAWEAATIVDTAAVIGHNYQVGIRLGARNRPAGCAER